MTNDNSRILTNSTLVKSYPIGPGFKYNRSCLLFIEETGQGVPSVTARYTVHVFSIRTVRSDVLFEENDYL